MATAMPHPGDGILSVLPGPQMPPAYQLILGKTAQLLLQDGAPDTVCQTLFEALRGPLRLDVYFHYLVSEDGQYLELASSGGNEIVRAALGSTLAFGEAVCGTVAQRCTGMVVTNVQSRMDQMTGLIRSFGIRCYTCNPIIVQGRLVGTFSFGSSHRDSFNPTELELLKQVVEQVTMATERRIQNEHLRSLERMATVGRISATLAHEINNPLEALSTLLYLLRADNDSPRAAQLLEQAQQQVGALSEASVRTLNRFRGTTEVPRSIDMSELAHDLGNELQLPHYVTMETDIEDGLQVFAVPDEMRQCLFNLLMNAGQFSPAGGVVTLSVQRSGGDVEIRVRDHGPGIAPEMRGRIFQPFNSMRSKSGTGVGLWVTHQMVERSGGTLQLVPSFGNETGCEFLLTMSEHVEPRAMANIHLMPQAEALLAS